MQDTLHTITVDISNANQRFDRFLRKFYKPYTTVTLPTIYSWIRKWYIRINNKRGKEDTKVLLWDEILINISQTTPLFNKKNNSKNLENKVEEKTLITSHIIYEDTNWLAFNKPPHMLMHPGSWASQKAVTMNDWLYSYLNIISREKGNDNMITKGSMFKPAFGYRLDKDTSGVLIAAKTYEALQYLNNEIRERAVVKWYVIITEGKLPKHTYIDKPLFKWFHGEKGRAHMFVNYEKWLPSQTHLYHIADKHIPRLGTVSLGLARIMTGRMHQIRVHSASEWYPVLGDKDYGNAGLTRILYKEFGVSRQLLHSFSYTLRDLDNKKNITFTAALPDDMQKLFPSITEDQIKNIIQKNLHN